MVSLISFVGLFILSASTDRLRKVSFLLVALAVGALLGDTFIHILPEIFTGGEDALMSGLIIAGILLFFVLERFLHWHHHGHDETEPHLESPKALGQLVLISDGVHNFLDGIVIATSFLVSMEVGIATTLAVMLHEIPQEIGDFGVLIHAGYKKAQALWFNFLSAMVSILGVVFVFIARQYVEGISEYALPLTAGMFLYIATSDLVPELRKNKGAFVTTLQLFAIGVGVLAMFAITFFE